MSSVSSTYSSTTTSLSRSKKICLRKRPTTLRTTPSSWTTCWQCSKTLLSSILRHLIPKASSKGCRQYFKNLHRHTNRRRYKILLGNRKVFCCSILRLSVQFCGAS
eukprot:PhF_6_TR40429/c0_g2_i1/m.60283